MLEHPLAFRVRAAALCGQVGRCPFAGLGMQDVLFHPLALSARHWHFAKAGHDLLLPCHLGLTGSVIQIFPRSLIRITKPGLALDAVTPFPIPVYRPIGGERRKRPFGLFTTASPVLGLARCGGRCFRSPGLAIFAFGGEPVGHLFQPLTRRRRVSRVFRSRQGPHVDPLRANPWRGRIAESGIPVGVAPAIGVGQGPARQTEQGTEGHDSCLAAQETTRGML